MPKLSLRIKTILHMIPASCKRLIDVGCDHGFLSAAFLTAFPKATALLIDRREGPLAKARETVQPFGDRACCLLSDGLSDWQAQNGDVIVIAGMGAIEIDAILNLGFEGLELEQPVPLLLQPMRDGAYLRAKMRETEQTLREVRLVKDKGYVYAVDFFCLDKRYNRQSIHSVEPLLEDWLPVDKMAHPDITADKQLENLCLYGRRQCKIAANELPSLSEPQKEKRSQLLKALDAAIDEVIKYNAYCS